MNPSEIKKLLHHRDPYLMVDTVIEIDDSKIHTQKVMKDHPIIPGHFPGAPLVPGAMIQEMCTQSAGLLITKFYSPVEDYDSEATQGYALGVLRAVHKAEYIGMNNPTIPVDIKVQLEARKRNRFTFTAEASQNGNTTARLNFELVNIPDASLRHK